MSKSTPNPECDEGEYRVVVPEDLWTTVMSALTVGNRYINITLTDDLLVARGIDSGEVTIQPGNCIEFDAPDSQNIGFNIPTDQDIEGASEDVELRMAVGGGGDDGLLIQGQTVGSRSLNDAAVASELRGVSYENNWFVGETESLGDLTDVLPEGGVAALTAQFTGDKSCELAVMPYISSEAVNEGVMEPPVSRQAVALTRTRGSQPEKFKQKEAEGEFTNPRPALPDGVEDEIDVWGVYEMRDVVERLGHLPGDSPVVFRFSEGDPFNVTVWLTSHGTGRSVPTFSMRRWAASVPSTEA